MKIRGERECADCGTRWSYYETGSVGCPACGSVRSRGIDDPTEHTDVPVAFDLTPVRDLIDASPLQDVAEAAIERCRSYVRRRGFVRGGDLAALDDTYLAANELLHVGSEFARALDPDEREQLYLLALLRGADQGERPPVEDVPSAMTAPRGLAYANAVFEYRRELRTWCDAVDRALDAETRSAIETLGDHVTRIRMLDGDVSPETAEELVAATRDLATALREHDETALDRARAGLDDLV